MFQSAVFLRYHQLFLLGVCSLMWIRYIMVPYISLFWVTCYKAVLFRVGMGSWEQFCCSSYIYLSLRLWFLAWTLKKQTHLAHLPIPSQACWLILIVGFVILYLSVSVQQNKTRFYKEKQKKLYQHKPQCNYIHCFTFSHPTERYCKRYIFLVCFKNPRNVCKKI